MHERMHQKPPRRRMAEIAGRLGIEPLTTSKGGSVLRDFLEIVGDAIGLDRPAAQFPSKDALLGAIVSELTGKPIRYRLNGGTVTNNHLDDILHGLDELEITKPVEIPVRTTIPDAFHFDLDDMADARRIVQRTGSLRERAADFREALMQAYDSRCAITDADAAVTLEAAHIYPYRGSWTNAVQNGLLLRADMHRAFDRGYIGVDTSRWSIVVATDVAHTSLGREVAGRRLRLPSQPAKRPSIEALDRHRDFYSL